MDVVNQPGGRARDECKRLMRLRLKKKKKTKCSEKEMTQVLETIKPSLFSTEQLSFMKTDVVFELMLRLKEQCL